MRPTPIRKWTVLLFTAAFALPSPSQPLTLEACQRAARSTFPMIRAAGLAEEAKAYNLANAARGWLSILQAEGKAQVQSDVTSLPFDLSKLGISGLQTPKMSRDQYAISLSIQQPIYEGGRIKAAKQLAEARAGIAQAAVEVNLYALREQVNQTYFGLLLIREQLRLNALLQDNIRRSLSQTEAMIRSGIAHDTDRRRKTANRVYEPKVFPVR